MVFNEKLYNEMESRKAWIYAHISYGDTVWARTSTGKIIDIVEYKVVLFDNALVYGNDWEEYEDITYAKLFAYGDGVYDIKPALTESSERREYVY